MLLVAEGYCMWSTFSPSSSCPNSYCGFIPRQKYNSCGFQWAVWWPQHCPWYSYYHGQTTHDKIFTNHTTGNELTGRMQRSVSVMIDSAFVVFSFYCPCPPISCCRFHFISLHPFLLPFSFYSGSLQIVCTYFIASLYSTYLIRNGFGCVTKMVITVYFRRNYLQFNNNNSLNWFPTHILCKNRLLRILVFFYLLLTI